MWTSVKNFFMFKNGLREYARASNTYLNEWLLDDTESKDLTKLNAILVDFPDPHCIQNIVNLNFKFL